MTAFRIAAHIGLVLALIMVASPAGAQKSPRDLIRDEPTAISEMMGAAWTALARVGGAAGSALGALLPPTPGDLAASARSDDTTELSRLLGLAGYKLKEIDNEIGIIPSLSFKFAIARELTEADKDYLDEQLELSFLHHPSIYSDLQRAIVRTVAAINSAGGMQVSDLKVALLPLPKVAFTVSPTEGAMGEEASTLMRAIQRVDRRVRAIAVTGLREGPAVIAGASRTAPATATSGMSYAMAIGVALAILAGLGQFFIGMKLLSTYLKEAASDRVRQMAGRLARHPALIALVGLAAGAVTQSTNAVTAAATGLATVEIITLRQALPLIACASIGTSVLVFLAAIDIRDAIFAATAICGGLFFAGLDQSKRYRAVVGAFLALILIITGMALVTSSARALRDVAEIRDLVAALSGSAIGAFLVGAALTPIVQTAKTVAVIVASLAAAGLVAPADAILAVVGANLTSAANVAFLTARVSRKGRALALYQALLKILGSLLIVPVVPILSVLAPEVLDNAGTFHAALMVAVAYLAMQVVAFGATLPFEAEIERKILDIVGRDDPSEIGRPRFISAEALRDPATATVLAFREHLGALAGLPAHLDGVREGGVGGAEAARVVGEGAASLLKATDDFLRALGQEANDQSLRDRVNSLQRLNGLAVSLQEQARELAGIATGEGARAPEAAARLAAIVESAHLLLDAFVGFTQEPDGIGREMLAALTGDRAAVMEGVRRAVTAGGDSESDGQRVLFDACLCFERMVWLMRRYVMVCDEPSSPYVIERVEEAVAAAAD